MARIVGITDARPTIEHCICSRKPRGGRSNVIFRRIEEATVSGFVDELERGDVVAFAVGVAEVDTTGADPVDSEREILRVRGGDLLEPVELLRSQDG